MKSKILAVLSIIYIYIYTIAAVPNAWALDDATSFNPEQVQVQAANNAVPIGTVIVWTKEIIPDGWLECNGQPVNETLYPDLHELMPTTPNYQGRFLQGTDTNTNVGERIEAGIPNLWGYMGEILKANQVNGAFYQSNKIFYPRSFIDAGYYSGDIFMDASRCSPVYGKSTTVQPPSVVVKYIIKAE